MVKSAVRVLDVMEHLALAGPQTFTELQRTLGIPKASLHGLVADLEARAFISRYRETGEFCVGPRAFEVGTAFLNGGDLEEVLRGPMQLLSNRYRCASQFAVLNGSDVLYLLKVEPESATMTLSTRPGTRLPAQFTALGKAILSTMSDAEVLARVQREPWALLTPNSVRDPASLIEQLKVARSRDWAVDDEESRMGVRCVGSAVKDRTNRCVGAVSLTFLKQSQEEEVISVGEELARCLADLAARLG